jgi:hypothetical protein
VEPGQRLREEIERDAEEIVNRYAIGQPSTERTRSVIAAQIHAWAHNLGYEVQEIKWRVEEAVPGEHDDILHAEVRLMPHATSIVIEIV